MKKSKAAAAAAPGMAKKPGAVFGRPVRDVMGKTLKVPAVVQETVSFLMEPGRARVEGLFRVSGSVADIERIKRDYDAGKTGLHGSFGSVHTAAGVLKLYLRTLPNCLFLNENYEALKDAGDDTDEIRSIIDELPKENRKVLKRVMDLLVEVVECSGSNKMNSKSLGTCLGPNLIRPDVDEEEDAESMLDVAATSGKLLANILDNAEELFDYEVSGEDEPAAPQQQRRTSDDDDGDESAPPPRSRTPLTSSNLRGGGPAGKGGGNSRKLYHGSDDSGDIEEIPTTDVRGASRQQQSDDDDEDDDDKPAPPRRGSTQQSAPANRSRNGSTSSGVKDQGRSTGGGKKAQPAAASGTRRGAKDSDDPFAPSDDEDDDEDDDRARQQPPRQQQQQRATKGGGRRPSTTTDASDDDDDASNHDNTGAAADRDDSDDAAPDKTKGAKGRAAGSAGSNTAGGKGSTPAATDKKKSKADKTPSPGFFSKKNFKSMFGSRHDDKHEAAKEKSSKKQQPAAGGSDDEAVDEDGSPAAAGGDNPPSGKKLSPAQKKSFKSLVAKTVSGLFDRNTGDELSRSLSAKSGGGGKGGGAEPDAEDAEKPSTSSKRSSSVPRRRPAEGSDDDGEKDDHDNENDQKRRPKKTPSSKSAASKFSSAPAELGGSAAHKAGASKASAVALPESDDDSADDGSHTARRGDGRSTKGAARREHDEIIRYDQFLATRLQQVSAMTPQQRSQDDALLEELAAFEDFISKFSELVGRKPAAAKSSSLSSSKRASQRLPDPEEPKSRDTERPGSASSHQQPGKPQPRPKTPTTDSDDEPPGRSARPKKKESRESLQEKYDAAVAEKRELQASLKTFETKFMKKNGRKVATKEDRAPMLAEYARYKDLKAELADLESKLGAES